MILTYHEIGATPSPYIYGATVSELREHVGLIRSFCKSLPPARITFDDGHQSQFAHALPVLEEARQKATFFITAGWTGTRGDYMTWAQLRQLTALGHQVQAHGLTHALLTHCAADQLTAELRDSKRRLEDGLGLSVDAISMPGGRWDVRVLKACEAEGYRVVYTSHPYAPIRRINGTTVMGRAMVRRATDAAALLALLRSEQDRWSRERIQFRLKHNLRLLLGDRFYHQLWSWAGHSAQSAAAQGRLTGGLE
jgi:peptidoglycan/xylan/chitin deacetylase (PgdA/CDA1 family)